MTEQELALVLASHKKWLNRDKEGHRANLRSANLSGVNLSGASLSYADLSYANLSGADLSRADLSRANLHCANLRCYADLSRANLNGADLSYASLSFANLSYASLNCVDLNRADLSSANLRGAELDFSCLPLWCGSLTAQFDDKQIIQIIYHAVKAGLNSSNVSKKVKTELMKLVDLANKFHRANECGKINKEKKKRGSKIDKETTES